MSQEFRLNPDGIIPLRHFDDEKMSFETYRFRKSGPSVRIPTYPFETHAYHSPGAQVDDGSGDSGDSDDSYPLERVSTTPMNGLQQRKRRISQDQTWLIASDQSPEVMEKEKLWKTLMMKGVQWAQDPAGELQELTGWKIGRASCRERVF